MSNRSIYSVAKEEDEATGAVKVEDENPFDDFDDIEEEPEEPVVEEKPTEVKEEEVKKEEVIEEKEDDEEEEKPKQKETNKAGWCFDDFNSKGSIQPKIYASATGGSNVSVKKAPPSLLFQ